MPLLSPYRLAGLLALFGAMLIYDPEAISLWQRLGLPVLMALGAWLTAQSLMPVLLGVLVLAAIHSDLDAGDPLARLAYPALAALAGVAMAAMVAQRFRNRMRQTRSARWRSRQGPDHSAAQEQRESPP